MIFSRNTRRITFLVLSVVLAGIIFVGLVDWVGIQLTKPAPSRIGAPPSFLLAQTVHFPSAAGRTLMGWYAPGKPDCGTIVLMHALRGNRLSMVKRAQFLTEAGYAVLLFDFQGHGESEGEVLTFGFLEQEDARAAIRFVSRHHPKSRIGIVGVSLGGVAAVLNGPDLGADALVLEAVYSTFTQATINRIQLRVGLMAKPLAAVLLSQLTRELDIVPEKLKPIDHMTSLGVPVFIIGGTEDKRTRIEETRALFASARPPKKLWELEGAKHEDFHRFAREQYERRVLTFFDTHVGCSPITRK